MNTFPTLSSGQRMEGFIHEYGDLTSILTDPKYGAALFINRATFDAWYFTFSLRLVSDTDKDTLEAFYQANKEVVFYWLNEQDDETYEVIFLEKPHCELDGQKDRWKIDIKLVQA